MTMHLRKHPARIGIDARMLSKNPTGVGNYIAALLTPMCQSQTKTEFFLYSNSRVDYVGGPNVALREGGAGVGPAWMNFQLPAALQKDRIDVFWGANGVAPVRGKVPSVVTVHDLVYRFAGETMGRGARWTKRVFQGWSVRRASQVIAVSHATASDVAAVYHRPVNAVIPPLANPLFKREDRAAVREVLERYDLRQPYWLVAGTLEPRKNLVGLLSAYLALIDSGIDLPVLLLAGNAGWAASRLNELIARGVASACIRQLGYVPLQDLANLYAGCDILWMPSIYEGFGMPLLEAQRCGACVVHGDHASMVEASGGLGLSTGTDVASLRATLLRIASGEAPLACRLSQAEPGEAEAASRQLWDCFCAAVMQR